MTEVNLEMGYNGNFVFGDYVLVGNENEYKVYDNDDFHNEDISEDNLNDLYEGTLEQCIMWCWNS